MVYVKTSAIFNQLFLTLRIIQTSMSQSRKKVSSIDLSLLSHSEKTAEQHHRRDFKRKCCDKENQCSREGRQCRSKEDSRSLKKQLKKKYLQDEVQKMLQRRYDHSQTKIMQCKQTNQTEILGLRQDMKSMKDVIMKLSIEDKRPLVYTKDLNFQGRCHYYQSKLDKIEVELQSQRSRNAQLEQTQTQSQLFAEQTKKFSETIKLELEELSNKHLKCQETNRQLQKAHKKIKELQVKERQTDSKLTSSKNREQQLMEQTKRLAQLLQQTENLNKHIKEKSELLSEQNKKLIGSIEAIKQAQTASTNKSQQELQQFQSSYEQLLEDKELLHQQLLKKMEGLQEQLGNYATLKKSLQARFEESQSKLKIAEELLKKQSYLKAKLEMEINKMQNELNKTNIDLGNTKSKLDGLSSMEQKCEELYEQIKKQKSKWSNFSQQSCQERKMYETNLKLLQSKNNDFSARYSQAVQKCSQLESGVQKLRQDNYRLVEDKAKLARQLKIIEDSAKQAENLRYHLQQSTENRLKCREAEWKQQKASLQSKIQHLSNEVKGSLQVAKRQSDDILANNESMQREITRLMHEKQILYERFNNIQQIVIQNQDKTVRLQHTLSIKEKQTKQQQIIINQTWKRIDLYQIKLKTAQQAIVAENHLRTELQSTITQKIAQVESLAKSIAEKERAINVLENQIAIQTEETKKISCLLEERTCSSQNISNEMHAQSQKINELSNIIEIHKVVTETQQQKIKEIQQKLEDTECLLQQATQNLNKIESNGRTIIFQLEKKYECIKIKLDITENESKTLKLRYSEHENQLQSQRAKRQESESKVRSLESLSFSLTTQLEQLQSCTKRSEEQLEWYQSEINHKNKSIGQLKETLRMVKNESILIKEEVSNYQAEFEHQRQMKQKETNKLMIEVEHFAELERLTGESISYMRQRLDDLNSDKLDIQIQLQRTQQKNEELQEKIKHVYVELDIKEEYENKVQILTDRMTEMKQQDQAFKKTLINERNQLLEKIENKNKEISMLQSIIQEERSAFTLKIEDIQSQASSNKANLESQTVISQKLTKIINEKQQIINKLTEKNTSYEEKRVKIINEVHSIQNQITELSERNNMLQADNAELQQRLRESDEKIRIFEQKIVLLMQNKYAMEEQKNALEDQSKCLQQQVLQAKSRQKLIQQQSQRKIKELYTLSEQRKNETANVLNEKIQQLTYQISVSIERLKQKEVQFEQVAKKQRNLQSILKQNHFLLAEERKERERLVIVNQQLTATIENTKHHNTNKDRQYECLLREKTILKEKWIEIQSRYESLAKRYENTEREKFAAQRQIENQALTLRVLREENQSIERVMSEQLNQRKAIIEQLVNEKRMLYSQYHQ